MKDKTSAVDSMAISIASNNGIGESSGAHGVYTVKCYESEGGKLLWDAEAKIAPNVVCTLGKNLMLQSSLQGSAYTVTGPYMGLISSVGFTAVSAADTIASHTGWNEAGTTNAPTFAARVAPSFSTPANGAISTSAPTSFTMTGAGTVQGAFIVYGTGATNAIGNTGGVLLSAGVFTNGAQPVASGNIVQVNYGLTLS
jgi:hypothetical protein